MWSSNRFFAKKVEIDGIVFDSKVEAERYLELRDMEEEGLISDLCCDKTRMHFEIIPKQMRQEEVRLKTKTKIVYKVDESAAIYTPDFTYFENGVYVIEEVKSKATKGLADYILRRKLIKRLIKEHNTIHPDEPWEFRERVSEVRRKKRKR